MQNIICMQIVTKITCHLRAMLRVLILLLKKQMQPIMSGYKIDLVLSLLLTISLAGTVFLLEHGIVQLKHVL